MNKFWVILFAVYVVMLNGARNRLIEIGGGKYTPLGCVMFEIPPYALKEVQITTMKKCLANGTSLNSVDRFATALVIIPLHLVSNVVESIEHTLLRGKPEYIRIICIIFFILGPVIGAILRDLSKYCYPDVAKQYYGLGWSYTLITGMFGSWLITGRFYDIGSIILFMFTFNVICIAIVASSTLFVVNTFQGFITGKKIF